MEKNYGIQHIHNFSEYQGGKLLANDAVYLGKKLTGYGILEEPLNPFPKLSIV